MSDALVIEVVRKTVTVDCTVEEAFRMFTADAMSWWPVDSHSISGTVSEIVFEPREGGEVYEVSSSGEKGHWATVVDWDPPTRLVLAWNILEREGDATEVEVRFLPGGRRHARRSRAPRVGARRCRRGGQARRLRLGMGRRSRRARRSALDQLRERSRTNAAVRSTGRLRWRERSRQDEEAVSRGIRACVQAFWQRLPQPSKPSGRRHRGCVSADLFDDLHEFI